MAAHFVSQRDIAWRAVSGAIVHLVRRPREFRYHVLRDLWSLAKRFGARYVRSVEPRQIDGLPDMPMTAFYDDPNRAVLAALCRRLGARTFFEIGTNRGRTAWTVAANNPEVRVYTLDLPDSAAAAEVRFELTDHRLFREWARGEAFLDTPEAMRIEMLLGDSATFDYEPYAGVIDLVYVDGSHSYSYVKNDTEAALRMLSPQGAIVWDDYPGYAGVYAYLEELAPQLDAPLLHVYGTRLVVYSRQPLVADLEARQLPVSPASA